MRNEFIKILCEKAKNDPNVVLITADLGYGVLEKFSEQFPKQFFNVGVSEQLMIGMAGGMAKMGKKVYCYSINNFASFRCLEQIRNDVAYPNLDVTIISLGAGLNYDNYGYTHYGIEDINAVACLPNIAIWSPANFRELNEAMEFSGPSYIRLGKGIGNREANRITESHDLIVSYSDLIGDILDDPKFNDYNVCSFPLLKINRITKKYVNNMENLNFCNCWSCLLIEEHINSNITSLVSLTSPRIKCHKFITDDWINQGFSPDKTVMSDRQWVVEQLLKWE